MKIINVKQKNQRTTNCIITFKDELNILELELSMDLVVRERLSANTEISNALYEQLVVEQKNINAKQKAFNYVSYRKKTKKQVIDKLKQNDFTDEEINSAINYLITNDLLDDEVYAKCFVKDILLTKKNGKNKVFNMLYERGVDKEIIIKVLEEHFPKDTLETAIIVAERKYKLIKNKTNEKIKQSLFNHLVLKGFSFDESQKAINIVLSEHNI